MMGNLMPFDELNKLKEGLSIHFENGKIRSAQDCEDIIDELLDLFLLAAADGITDAETMLYTGVDFTITEIMEIIDRDIDGMNWRERVRQHFNNGDPQSDIERLVDTETHRDYNEAAFNAAIKSGATMKQWHCMMLPTSRDTHIYLDNVEVPIDALFNTFNGHYAMFPGQFGLPEEDINCLCWLTFR